MSTDLFHDARVEEILNENTLRLTIRKDDDKFVKNCYIDEIKQTNIISDDDKLKAIFMTDLLSSIIPVGTFIKIKILENDNIALFNRSLDKNINNLLKIVQDSNASYVI